LFGMGHGGHGKGHRHDEEDKKNGTDRGYGHQH
jgi:hypothetical protein